MEGSLIRLSSRHPTKSLQYFPQFICFDEGLLACVGDGKLMQDSDTYYEALIYDGMEFLGSLAITESSSFHSVTLH